ncbi:MAG TPA: putative nucleotidyltransferase substrate binding domain-containing protein [Solirubrobacteraceae bacterium]|nr:putative nucleotidyltransferase substrate binding domain-containing protein [Solirubrobacteraceae bacterium]
MRQPPFDSLDPAALRAVLAEGSELRLREGEKVLVEDGLPASGLYLICSGSIELVHEGERIQILEPGECFGHPSLLTGMAPAFTVRAHEDSVCLVLPREAALRVLGRPEGAGYVASTMRQRLTRTGHTVHGLLDVGTTPVSALVRPARYVGPHVEVREAARLLGEDGVSALLVRLEGSDADALGIITDADVRAHVAAGGSVDAPARALARTPVPTVHASQLAVEATVDMLAAGAEHVAVADNGAVAGLLSAGDLLGLDARSPIALRHTINGAADEDVLVGAVSHLPKLFTLLVRAGVPPRDLGRVLSLQNDAVTARLIDFALSRHGPAPVPWAWLTLGSAARREFTLASDQDNALAYATPAAGEEERIDAYFAHVAAEVNQGLVRCGFGADNNGVLAGNRRWRMSKAGWIQTFDDVLREPDESHLIRASVAFDFRHSLGGLAITAPLAERIRAAREHPGFMRLMARTATGYPVALGFRGQLAVEKHGPEAGRLDLKRGAIIPLVNLVRFHALAAGVTISPTLDRIDAVASAGGLDGGLAEALREAFEVITRVRFDHHAACIAEVAGPDNLLDPGALAPIARGDLREALHNVRRAQKLLAVWAPMGV